MSDLFKRCVEIILKHEGGYVNDPDDYGGETNMGIAKRYFPDEDIKNMTKERAIELYYDFIWLKMNLVGISDEDVILEMFDMGVNSSLGSSGRRAIKIAQRLLGVKPDGYVGTITIMAINDFDGNFLKSYKEARRRYYKGIVTKRPQNMKFLKGWFNRIDSTHF